MSQILKCSAALEIIHLHWEEFWFGFVAKDEANLGSDVDLLMNLSHPTWLLEIWHLKFGI